MEGDPHSHEHDQVHDHDRHSHGPHVMVGVDGGVDTHNMPMLPPDEADIALHDNALVRLFHLFFLFPCCFKPSLHLLLSPCCFVVKLSVVA